MTKMLKQFVAIASCDGVMKRKHNTTQHQATNLQHNLISINSVAT